MNYSTTFQTFKQTAYQPIQLPNENRNYSIIDKRKVDFYVKQREKALPQLENILKKSNDEKEIICDFTLWSYGFRIGWM